MYAVTKSIFSLSLLNIQNDKKQKKYCCTTYDDNVQHLIPQVEKSERDHLDVRVSRIEESVERFVDSMRIVFQMTKLSI